MTRWKGYAIGTLLAGVLALTTPESHAQNLGTFSWQFVPFCNVVTLSAVQQGPVFVVSGFDDQCGGARASASGTAFFNADGSVGMGLTVVAPGGAPLETVVTLSPTTLSGSWSDNAGNAGTFAFNPAPPTTGSPRPDPVLLQGPAGPAGPQGPPGPTDVPGNITLANSTATAGNILKGGLRFLHNFGGNTFLGGNAGNFTATGTQNVGLGAEALEGLAAGNANTGVGSGALQSNASGGLNTAVGATALAANIDGSFNTAVGGSALFNNGPGGANTALGTQAMQGNTVGNDNTAVGFSALATNQFGDQNVAVGEQALLNADGDGNIAIGWRAGVSLASGSNNIYIGNGGQNNDLGTIRIGGVTHTRFFAAGVRAVTTGQNNAIPVLIDQAGQLGTISSARRFKEDIQDMGDASRDLLRLRPVTYRYTADEGRQREYGLIAEDVAQVYPELVVHDDAGRVLTVRYHVLPAMLLNELQRLAREVETLRAEVTRLRAGGAQPAAALGKEDPR